VTSQTIQNKAIFLSIVILMLNYSIESMAMEPLQFTIKSNNEYLLFSLTNRSYDDILVNNIFSIGPSGRRGNIELIFVDLKGIKHELSAKINFSKFNKNKILSLSPNYFTGKAYSFSDIKKYYQLNPGEYKVEGFYKNYYGEEYGVFIGSSNISGLTIKIK